MSPRNAQISYLLIATPVVLVILGAFVLSVSAVAENLHFLRATSQILDLTDTVRSVAAQQKNIAFNASEDIWDDLIQIGQIPSNINRSNGWGGQVRATSLGNNIMRIESDLPVHDCRRMALYFLARRPAELGLLTVEAQSLGDKVWKPVYPPPAGAEGDLSTEACGKAANARLALVFRIR